MMVANDHRHFPFASVLLRAVALCLCLSAVPVSAQDERPRPTHVLLISLDGARPDALLLAETPNIQGLALAGAAAWEASTVLPPATLPAHASMLTGLSVELHGVDYNGNDAGCPVIEPPTILTLAEQAGYRAALVTGKEKLCLFRQSDTLDYTFAREGDRSVVERVLQLLDEGYNLVFVHFPNPDYFGHSAGWMSESYLYELRNTDFQVGRILARLEALDLADDTLIILTADHGGHDKVHGADRPEDRLIPWIIAGPGVVPGTLLDDSVTVTDTAPTVLWALDLPLPDHLSGRPVTEAFGVPVEATPETVGQ